MVLVAAVLVLGGVAGAVFYGHRRAPVPADPAAGAGARTVRSEDLLQFVCAQHVGGLRAAQPEYSLHQAQPGCFIGR